MSVSYRPGTLPSELCSLLLPLRPPVAGRFTPGTFTNHILAAFQEPGLLVVTDPRMSTRLSLRHPVLTCLSLLCVTETLLCSRWTLPSFPTQGGPLSRCDVIRADLEALRMCDTISQAHPWEVLHDVYFYIDPAETEKEEQAVTEKAVTKEEFQGGWTAGAPDFTAAQPEVVDWSEGAGALCACSAVPTGDCPAVPTAQATEWVATTSERS